MKCVKYCSKCGSVIIQEYQINGMTNLCDLCIGEQLQEPRKKSKNIKNKIVRDIMRKPKRIKPQTKES